MWMVVPVVLMHKVLFTRQYVLIACQDGTSNQAFPTTPGAWSETNPAATVPGCNLAMVKIEMDFAGVGAAPQSLIDGVPRDTSGCVPLTVDFTDTVQNAISYEWDFGDGHPCYHFLS